MFAILSYDDRLNSVTRNLLIALPMRPHDPKLNNSHLRERLNTAKLNANRLRFKQKKIQIFLIILFVLSFFF
jgi:hypothetical protein